MVKFWFILFSLFNLLNPILPFLLLLLHNQRSITRILQITLIHQPININLNLLITFDRIMFTISNIIINLFFCRLCVDIFCDVIILGLFIIGIIFMFFFLLLLLLWDLLWRLLVDWFWLLTIFQIFYPFSISIKTTQYK